MTRQITWLEIALSLRETGEKERGYRVEGLKVQEKDKDIRRNEKSPGGSQKGTAYLAPRPKTIGRKDEEKTSTRQTLRQRPLEKRIVQTNAVHLLLHSCQNRVK